MTVKGETGGTRGFAGPISCIHGDTCPLRESMGRMTTLFTGEIIMIIRCFYFFTEIRAVTGKATLLLDLHFLRYQEHTGRVWTRCAQDLLPQGVKKKPQDSAGFWQGPSSSIPHPTRAHSLTSTFCLEITRLASLCLLFPCPAVALGRPGFRGSSLSLQTPISCSLWNVRQEPPPSSHQPPPLLDFPP